VFPEELKVPLAIAEDFLDPSATTLSSVAPAGDLKAPEESAKTLLEQTEEVASKVGYSRSCFTIEMFTDLQMYYRNQQTTLRIPMSLVARQVDF
jgi:hypothetical protein